MTTRRYATWRKSSHSDDGNCVEVALADDDIVGVRDSKNRTGPIMEFDRVAWRAFSDDIRAGKFGL